jgi:hypothetical protein
MRLYRKARLGKCPLFRRVSVLLCFCLVSQICLTGCGGGGGGAGNTTPPVQTHTVNGAITTAEIGGTDLRVVSAWSGESLIDSSGRFDAAVSTGGAQLLMVQDSDGKTRALTISIPGSRSRAGADLTVDAESTALSMIFITPGILTTEPAAAAERSAQIKSLSGFAGLVDLVRIRLKTVTFDDLLISTAVNDAAEQCVEEWLNRYAPVAGATSRGIIPGVAQSGFSVSEPDEFKEANAANPAKTRLKLSNAAWRWVSVKRLDLRYGTEKNGTPVAVGDGPMNGAVSLSWGSIFTHTNEQPTPGQDEVDFSPASGATTSEYWVFGPGWKAGPTPPASVDSDAWQAWGQSIVYYVLFPILDLLSGGLAAFKPGADSWKAAGGIWRDIKGGINLNQLTTAADDQSRLRAFINVLVICVGGLTAAVLGAVVGPAAAAGLVLALGAMGGIMAGYNFICAMKNWVELQSAVKIVVTTTGDGVVVVQ